MSEVKTHDPLDIIISTPSHTYRLQWTQDASSTLPAVRFLMDDRLIAYGIKGIPLTEDVLMVAVEKVLDDVRKHVTNVLSKPDQPP